MKHRTHTGEIVTGERLQKALDTVADWYAANARAVIAEDPFAPHVTAERKAAYLAERLDHAEEVRAGRALDGSTWQRVNEELTGECIALLGGAV